MYLGMNKNIHTPKCLRNLEEWSLENSSAENGSYQELFSIVSYSFFS